MKIKLNVMDFIFVIHVAQPAAILLSYALIETQIMQSAFITEFAYLELDV
jgi:hypothetical protein